MMLSGNCVANFYEHLLFKSLILGAAIYLLYKIAQEHKENYSVAKNERYGFMSFFIFYNIY